MPTPKKTLAELMLSGTFQQNKKRYEHLANPVVTVQLPVGRPPAHLGTAERAVWTELVRVAHRARAVWDIVRSRSLRG